LDRHALTAPSMTRHVVVATEQTEQTEVVELGELGERES
jgi:hypothetical protein